MVAIDRFSELVFIDRLKGRDREALSELADAYLSQLLRAARGMGFTREESEDLAQSVFTVLIEKIDRFEARSHIRTYIFGIFYNKVSEYMRGQNKIQDREDIDGLMESRFDSQGRWRRPPHDIERLLYSQEIGDIIGRCLESIPRAQRIAFYLRQVAELTTEEICKKMGITATNLSVLLFRARNRLRECVERKGLKGA